MSAPLATQRIPLRALTFGSRGVDPRPGVERRIQEELRAAMAGRKLGDGSDPMRPGVWSALQYLPKFTLGLTLQSLNAPGVMDHLKAHPAAAFYALTSASSNLKRFDWLASVLEPTVAADGEILAYYLTWLLDSPVPDVDVRPLRNLLLSHPIHGCRWAREHGDREYGREMLAWAQNNATTHASAAWAAIVGLGHNADGYRPLLQLDPLYMSACAAATGMRFSASNLPEGLSGRAIFMLLRNGACDEPEELEKLLANTDPFWATEWHLHAHNGEKAPHVATILQRAKQELSDGNPLVTPLVHTWNAIAASIGVRTTNQDDNGHEDDAEPAARTSTGEGDAGEDDSDGTHSARS